MLPIGITLKICIRYGVSDFVYGRFTVIDILKISLVIGSPTFDVVHGVIAEGMSGSNRRPTNVRVSQYIFAHAKKRGFGVVRCQK
jgi:hypothetical protein